MENDINVLVEQLVKDPDYDVRVVATLALENNQSN